MLRKQPTPRDYSGFTLIELLVVVIIIAILAAVALPKFVDTQKKARSAVVKVNMHSVQMAAEAYARDHDGIYPDAPPTGQDVWSSYFPGGSTGSPVLKPGTPLTNPFTNKSLWTNIVLLKLNADNVISEKGNDPAHAGIIGALPGQIGYVGIVDPEGKTTSYAIEGVDNNGIAVADDTLNSPLVLTNQQ